MNGSNPLNLPITPTTIAVGCGLVGCVILGGGVMLKGADQQMSPIVVGAGSAALVGSVLLGAGAYVGAKLQSNNAEAKAVIVSQPSQNQTFQLSSGQRYLAEISFIDPLSRSAVRSTLAQPSEGLPEGIAQEAPQAAPIQASTEYPYQLDCGAVEYPEEVEANKPEAEDSDYWDSSMPQFPKINTHYDYSFAGRE